MSNLIEIPGTMQQPQMNPQDLFNKLALTQQYLQHMDQGIMMMSTELMAIRAHVQMLQGMFIEKGLYTKEEEIEELYKHKVAEPIQKHIQKLQQMSQEAVDNTQQQQEQEHKEVEKTTDKTEEIKNLVIDDSDIVLPSEKHKVTRYK